MTGSQRPGDLLLVGVLLAKSLQVRLLFIELLTLLLSGSIAASIVARIDLRGEPDTGLFRNLSQPAVSAIDEGESLLVVSQEHGLEKTGFRRSIAVTVAFSGRASEYSQRVRVSFVSIAATDIRNGDGSTFVAGESLRSGRITGACLSNCIECNFGWQPTRNRS